MAMLLVSICDSSDVNVACTGIDVFEPQIFKRGTLLAQLKDQGQS